MNKPKFLIITALPFRKYGNQSLIRFVSMLLNQNNSVSLLTTGYDTKGENLINNSRFHYFKLKSPRDLFHNIFNNSKSTSREKARFKKNFFLKVKSEDILPPFGNHNIKTIIKRWIIFFLIIFDNIYLFIYLLLFRYKEVNTSHCIIAYEFNNAFVAKWLSVLFKKKLISKYQGVLLKASDRKILDCYLYYPDNFLGIIKSDLCIMVNDGTDGKFYASKRGNTNILFTNHGVYAREYNSSLISEFKNLYADKFFIFNNASGSLWKRVDRTMRFLINLSPEIRSRVIVLSTYYGPYQNHIRDYINLLGIDDCFKLIGNVTNEQCHALLKECHVVLMTNDMSNLGNPILEAIYYNIPAISINDESLEDLIKSNINGYLIDLDKDFDKNLAELITKLVINNTYLDDVRGCLANQSIVFPLQIQQQKEYDEICKLFK